LPVFLSTVPEHAARAHNAGTRITSASRLTFLDRFPGRYPVEPETRADYPLTLDLSRIP